MIDEKRLIAALQFARSQRADAALSQGTTSEPAFCYGREVGINQGYRMAEQLLLDMIKDEKEAA